MEDFDLYSQNSGLSVQINEELAAHKGLGYLTPSDLSVSELPIRRIALVGSCMMDAWAFQLQNPAGAQVDFFLTNNLSALPDRSNEDLAVYDFHVIQLPLRGILADDQLWRIGPDDEDALHAAFDECCGRIRVLLANHMTWNAQSGLLAFITNFMIPQRNSWGYLFRRYHLSNPQVFIDRLNEKLEEYVRDYRNAYILDFDNIASSLGRRYVQDDIYTTNSHGSMLVNFPANVSRIEPMADYGDYYEITQRQTFLDALWCEMSAMYRTARQADAVKLVVVDLDDTLWNGVSGEWGEDVNGGVAEGWPNGVVEALMYLKARGILLAIISKNEESRIREIWPKIFNKRITLEDFVAVKINWDPKVENMAEILEGVNLLPRSVVFIDDNPVERSAMKSAYPDMRILGRHPYHLKRTLLWSPETQVVNLTGESTRRTEMVQAQLMRETDKKGFSREEFLANASPKVRIQTIMSIDHPKFERAFELLNKTNQFNTTGKRWAREEAEAFFTGGGLFHIADVTDKYTSYGLVAVAVVGDSHIQQFVMSCRVFGYDIETAVMAGIVRGLSGVTARLIETNANFPCRDLFAKCGFDRIDGEWVLPQAAEINIPPHVELVGVAQPEE